MKFFWLGQNWGLNNNFSHSRHYLKDPTVNEDAYTILHWRALWKHKWTKIPSSRARNKIKEYIRKDLHDFQQDDMLGVYCWT